MTEHEAARLVAPIFAAAWRRRQARLAAATRTLPAADPGALLPVPGSVPGAARAHLRPQRKHTRAAPT